MSTQTLFKGRHFQADIILLNVRWYCRYALSYRDLEEMMQEREIEVDHATINRWVLKYASELDKRIRPYLRPTNDSWRVDETYIKVKGEWKYLYRTVGLPGNTLGWKHLLTFVGCVAKILSNTSYMAVVHILQLYM